MSMNENLEGKVSELTDVIKNLSEKTSSISQNDINNIVNSLTKRVEETQERTIERLNNNLSQSLLDNLDEKHREIQTLLASFENFASNVGKNIQNPNVEGEITRILNDIEAVHSKMNSQERQTEDLIKTFDAFKNSTSAAQLTKLCNEVLAISNSYDHIVETLNNNFQEFLKRVEETSSKEEFQKLKYSIDAVEGNQNVLVSAMNSINEKQEEIKAMIRQSWSNSSADKLEQVQNAIGQINRLITSAPTKADLDVLSEKFSNVVSMVADIKQNAGGAENSIISGQLNNIISQLNNFKLNPNTTNEDIVKLYASLSDLKNTLYNSLSTQINGLTSAITTKIDKISNSLINTNLNSNETISALTNEVQKLNNMVIEGLNSKTNEIKQNFKELGQNNVLTIVNSIKGELTVLLNQLSTVNSTDSIAKLAQNVESLKNGFDVNSVILQMDQLKASLNFEPIKEQLALLNKDEIIKSINQKIDLILNYSQSNEILSKLDELKLAANPSNIDFTSIEAKLVSIQTMLSNVGSNDDITYLKGKLAQIDDVLSGSTSFKNIEAALAEIRAQIEKSLEFNIEKINNDKQNSEEIKDIIKLLDTSIERNRTGIENALDTVGEKLTGIDLKLNGEDNAKLDEIKEQLEILYEFIKEINSKSINEQIDILKNTIVAANEQNSKNLSTTISQFQSAIALSFNAIKSGIEENLNSGSIGDSFTPFFDELSEKLSERISSLESLVEETGATGADKTKTLLVQGLDSFKNDIKSSITNYIEQIIEAKTLSIAEIIRNQTNETKIEVANYLKQESEILSSFFTERADSSNQALVDKVMQMISAKENSEAKINFIRNITEGLSELLNTVNILKDGYEANSDTINEINSQIGLINAKIEEMPQSMAQYDEIFEKINDTIENLNSKISNLNEQNGGSNIADAISVLNSEMQDKMNVLTANAELLDANFKDIIAQNNSDLKNSISETAESLNAVTSKINENIVEANANFENALTAINENIRSIASKTDFSPDGDKGAIIDALDDLNRNFISVQDRIEDLILKNNGSGDFEEFKNELSVDLNNLKSEIQNSFENSSKEEFQNSIQYALKDMSTAIDDIKLALDKHFSDIDKNKGDNDNALLGLSTMVEQKMNDKISVLEALIDDNINKINSSANDVLMENKSAINEKFEEFCSLSNENSQAIKSELQMQCETFLEKLVKVEALISAIGGSSDDEGCTIKSIASDISKIRLGIEKSDKLANFKEFASRLVELKNINLENAKISRVIGSDILRFDTWLKNTTAKIDVLAAKIDKSEKIKMDDLKARLANEKGYSSSKMEETLLSVYKKYRMQETKMDDISNKLEMLFTRQNESFDIKEFIDLFYDNMKKQEDLINRMDGLEDKMDLIQTKIDHIISSCIDD